MMECMKRAGRWIEILAVLAVLFVNSGLQQAEGKETVEGICRIAEQMRPYLTDETFAADLWDLRELDLAETNVRCMEFTKFFFPKMTEALLARPDVEAAQKAFKESIRKIEAVEKLSGGTVFTLWSKSGFLMVVPKFYPDAALEAEVGSMLESYPFYEPEDERTRRLAELQKKSVVVKQTGDAVLFFVSMPSLTAYIKNFSELSMRSETAGASESSGPSESADPSEIPGQDAENTRARDLAMLEELLESTAERPDIETVLGRGNFGKTHTFLLVVPPEFREILKTMIAGLDFENEKMKGISGAELLALADSVLAVKIIRDGVFDPGQVRVEFESETESALALEVLEKLIVSLLGANRPAEKDGSSPLRSDLAVFCRTLFLPELQGNALKLDWEERGTAAAEKYLRALARIGEFQAKQRAELRKDPEAEAQRLRELLEPWLTLQSTLVVKLDLERVTPGIWTASAAEELTKAAPAFFGSEKGKTALEQAFAVMGVLEETSEKMREAGAKEIFLILDLSNYLIPARIVIPGMKLSGEGRTDGIHAGTLFSFESFCADCMESVFPTLPELMSDRVCVGDWQDAAVLLMKSDNSISNADVWNSFVDSHRKAELENVRAALKYCTNSMLSVIYRMTPVPAMAINASLENAKAKYEELGEEPPFFIPPGKILTNGLDAVTLSVDPNFGTFSLNILGKNEKSARNLLKLTELWREDLLRGIEAAQKANQKNTGLSEEDLLLARLAAEDYVDWIFEFGRPICEGNRLYWDLSENERALRMMKSPFFKAAAIPSAVGICAGVMVPAFKAARENAQLWVQMESNLMQCSTAARIAAMSGYYPTAYTVDADGRPMHSWRVHLLPYLGQKELYEKIRLTEPWDSEWNRQFHDQCPEFYRLPADPDGSRAVIGVVVGDGCIFEPVVKAGQKGTRPADILDGDANTILFIACRPCCWMDPNGDLKLETLDPKDFLTANGRAFAALADGNAGSIDPNADMEVWRNLFLMSDEALNAIGEEDGTASAENSAPDAETGETEADVSEENEARIENGRVPDPVALPLPAGI